MHGIRKTEWDVPERLQGVYVWRGGAVRLSNELRPELLLLCCFTGRLDMARPHVVPEAHLKCPGETARAEPVGVAEVVLDSDTAVRVPEIHHFPERDLHSFPACLKEEDQPLRRGRSRDPVTWAAEAEVQAVGQD